MDEPGPDYPKRPVPLDEDATKALKKRTLTNRYNARPQGLVDAHEALDAVVAAAYGSSVDLSDVSGVILVATSVSRPFGAINSMWVPFLFGVVCLVVTAEEISFGQHFLGFSTPEPVSSWNTQDETNVHNFFSNDINYYAVFLVFYGYIGVFPILATYNQIVRALTLHLNIPKPSIAFARIMIPVFVVYSADLFIGREQDSLYGLREIRELMFALAILGTTINWRLTTCGDSWA